MIHNKHSPKSFKEMVGSDLTIRQLEKYIEKNNIPHCLLFYGERGCGKSSSANIIANSIPNAYIDIIDASRDNGVEVSRQIARNIKRIPMGYKNKIYILEEIHNVSDKFYDALLLVTNDPPDNIFFIIVTSEINKVSATIKSRFIEYKFTPPTMVDMTDYLFDICKKENIETTKKVIHKICKNNNNIPRDCLTDLEKIVGVKLEESQLLLIEKENIHNPTGYEISQLLAKGDWEKIRKILANKKNTSDIEGIRRTILNFFNKVLTGERTSEKNRKFASDVISEFEDAFFDAGLAGLSRRLYDLC